MKVILTMKQIELIGWDRIIAKRNVWVDAGALKKLYDKEVQKHTN